MLILSHFSRSMLSDRRLAAELVQITADEAHDLLAKQQEVKAVMPNRFLANRVAQELNVDVQYVGPQFVQIDEGQVVLVVETPVVDKVQHTEYIRVTVKGNRSLWDRLKLTNLRLAA